MMTYCFVERLGILVEEERKKMREAARFLREEVELRCGVRVPVFWDGEGRAEGPAGDGTGAGADGCAACDFLIRLAYRAGLGPEEFLLERDAGELRISAGDKRGFLYGGSEVLRNLYLKDGKIGIGDGLKNMRVRPSCAMRGHQLGYRDKQNTCPAWTETEYERYIRDLLIFGSNSIEILPPRTDDHLYSSHFKRNPLEMMKNLSRIIHSYGMEVHVWYPYLSLSIEGEEFEMEMREREEIFREVPYIDGLLIPAGDPGDLPPHEMFQASEAAAGILHKYHPDAKIWVAPQVFAPSESWYEEFYREVQKEPEWLYGVCFGPWEKDSIAEMYEKVPEKYRRTIRHYPDITHNIGSQFEVPDWDEAFSYTLGRESYNARPFALEAIHKHHEPYVMGSITYSEGIHDDVNKMVWGMLDYRSGEGPEKTVREYVRYFIDPDLEDGLAEIFLRLEESWRGKILENETIEWAYREMMEIDRRASEAVRGNYRYQMLLLRVLGDYQTKIRYAHDQEVEREAYRALENGLKAGQGTGPENELADGGCAKDGQGAGSENGLADGGYAKDSLSLIREARRILAKTYTEPVGVAERFRMQKLADDLYESCKIQLTTTRHKGQNLDRGAWLDTLNMALNDSQWMNATFTRIEKLESEPERQQALSQMLHRCDPGEGGQYLHLGSPEGFRHVQKTGKWEEDPGFLKSPLLAHQSHMAMEMYQKIGWYDEVPISTKWLHGARTLYGTPLVVSLEGLEPDAAYELWVTYPDLMRQERVDIRLWAGETCLASSIERKFRKGEDPELTYRYELPGDAYRDGCLRLKWETYGRLVPCNVSEVWVVKKR
ncbi:MAG: hypothetical protein Q4F41_11775 [Eubacteriales bacterium]|nr:hypothetical protein [Eubacteriales bacterium]